MHTSETIRADGRPRWFILTGLIHDLVKVLCLYGEPQWAVVGDTFPVGCAYSDKIVYPQFFAANPDPDMSDGEELASAAEWAGMSYGDLISRILGFGLSRGAG